MEKHITQEQWVDFNRDKLDNSDYFMVLDHISHCEFCSDILANRFPKEDMIKAPHYLKESIMKKAAKQPQYYLPQKIVSSKKQFLFYSLRVSTAIFGGLLIISLSLLGQLNVSSAGNKTYDDYFSKKEAGLIEDRKNWETNKKQEKDSFLNQINYKMRYFSFSVTNGLNILVSPKEEKNDSKMKSEVINYDKEKR